MIPGRGRPGRRTIIKNSPYSITITLFLPPLYNVEGFLHQKLREGVIAVEPTRERDIMQEKDLLPAILHELKEMKTSVSRLEKGQETLVMGQGSFVKGQERLVMSQGTLVKGLETLVMSQENLLKQVTAIKNDVAEINYIINQGVFSGIARLEKRIERLEQKAV